MLLDSEQHLPVKALFPFAGFWREHQVRQIDDSMFVEIRIW